MNEIRFLHAADIHLDSPFKGMAGMRTEEALTLRNSTFAAFDKFIAYAVETEPDFIIIAGDLYDGEVRSLRAQRHFQKAMEELSALSVPVFLSHGNHDHLSGSWTRFSLPSNVHVFAEKVESVPLTVRGRQIILHGFSYPKRHVHERMIEQFPAAEQEGDLHIGVYHGSVAGNTEHAVYAPFTVGEMAEKGYRYWALGHIHKRDVLSKEPPVVYPGNLQGRHRLENGVKGFYDVTLTSSDAQLQFVPASAVLFDELMVPCAGIRHANELLDAVCAAVFHYTEEKGPAVLSVSLTDADDEAAALLEEAEVSEWTEVLRESVADADPFVWIQQLRLPDRPDDERKAMKVAEPVIQKIESLSLSGWKDGLTDLYKHPVAGRYLDILTEQDTERLKERAESLLKQALRE